MTTLYKPVMIESVEQAEALPLGAPVWRIRPHAFTDDRGYVDTRSGKRMVDTDTGRHFAADMIGWTALVPVEAEEETREHKEPLLDPAFAEAHGIYAPFSVVTQQARLVTPWEPA